MRLIRVVNGVVIGLVPEAPDSWEAVYPQPEYRADASAQLGEVELPDGSFGPAPVVPPEPSPVLPLNAAQVIGWVDGKLAEAIAENPPNERLSWDLQVAEANAILAGATTPTPLLDTQASVTGESRAELANKVLGKKLQLAQYTGILIGLRRVFLDRIADGESLELADLETAFNLALNPPGGGQ